MLSGRFGKKLIYDKFSTIISIILTVSLVLGLIPRVDFGNSLLDGQNIKIESNINPNDYSLREMEDIPKIEDYSHIDTTQNHILEQDEIEEIPELEEFNNIESSQNIFPDQEEIESYIEDGSWEDRVSFMDELRPSGVGANLIQNLKSYEDEISDEFSFSLMNSNLPESIQIGTNNNMPAGIQTGMSTTGDANVIVLTVEFEDYTFNGTLDEQNLFDLYFDFELNMKDWRYPFNSLSAFYSRSSYGKLNIQGEIYTGAVLPEVRSYYDNNYEQLMVDVIEYYDNMGVDYSKFDGNSDGIIDNIYFHFAGPNTGWGSTWWSYCSYGFLYDDFNVDGMKVGTTVMLHDFNVNTIVHETGHVLGLDDYYDYGGDGWTSNRDTQTFDVMQNNLGDHNGFSKLLLGWIDKVTVIKEGEELIELNPLGECGEIAILFPEIESIFSEYYLIEYAYGRNFTPNGMQAAIPNGLRILHVNANTNDAGYFIYDNTGKGIKLIEAVNREYGNRYQGSIFLTGNSLTPYSSPSSGRYVYSPMDFLTNTPEKTYSGVFVKDIEYRNNKVSFLGGIEEEPKDFPLVIQMNYDMSILSNILEIEFEASGVFYENSETDQKPYIIIDGVNYNLDRKLSTKFYRDDSFKLCVKDEDLHKIESNTSYTVVIPEGVYYNELGKYNARYEFVVTTQNFSRAEKTVELTLSDYDWEPWLNKHFQRDDGKVIGIFQRGLANPLFRVVDFENETTSEVELTYPNKGEYELVLDREFRFLQLYDGTVVLTFKKSANELLFVNVDLFGNFINQVSCSFEDTIMFVRIIPFETGILVTQKSNDIFSKVTYVDFFGEGSINEINLSGLYHDDSSLSHLINKFSMHAVDQRSFCILENIINNPFNKAIIFDKNGNILQEINYYQNYVAEDYGDYFSNEVVIKKIDEDRIIFLDVINYRDSRNEYYINSNVVASVYDKGKLVKQFELLDSNVFYSYLENWDVKTKSTDFGFEILAATKDFEYDCSWNYRYHLLLYDNDFNLINSRVIDYFRPEIFYYSDFKVAAVFDNGYELLEQFDFNNISKYALSHNLTFESDIFELNENGEIEGLELMVTDMNELIGGITVDDGVTATIIEMGNGKEVKTVYNNFPLNSSHYLKLSVEDRKYSQIFPLSFSHDNNDYEIGPITNLRKKDITQNSAVLLFAKPIGANNIVVEFSFDNGNNWTAVEISDSITHESTSVKVENLEKNTEYIFRLNIIGGDRSGVSNTVALKTELYSPLEDFIFNRFGPYYNEFQIIQYVGAGEEVFIPREIDGFPVTKISDYANLGQSITSISIPKSVMRIGHGVFDYLDNLLSINVDSDNQYYTSIDGVLFNKDVTQVIRYPVEKSGGYVIPNSVTSIEESAFERCSRLTTITIPNSVTYIGDYAFAFCSNLSSAYFLGNAPQVDESVFRETSPSFTVYYLDNSGGFTNPWYGYETIIAKILFGNISITGLVKYSNQVTVDISNINPSNATISYQWKRNGVEIEVATDSTYTVTQEDIGQDITVTITGTGDYIGTITSDAVIPAKADGPLAPDAPILLSKTATSVILEEHIRYEYRVGDGQWQTSGEFTDLDPGKTYEFYQRVAETQTHKASESSGAIEVANYDYLLGDINDDARITTVDALMALQEASGRITLSDQQKLSADVNIDGRVTTVDALMILQYASGRISSFSN